MIFLIDTLRKLKIRDRCKENISDHVLDKEFVSRLYKEFSKGNKKTNYLVLKKIGKNLISRWQKRYMDGH